MQSSFRLELKIGRIVRLFIIGASFLEYLHLVSPGGLSSNEWVSTAIFVLLFAIQCFYTHEGTPKRVGMELAFESALLMALVLVNPDIAPTTFLLTYAPVIFRCGRNLPSLYGVAVALAIVCLPVAGSAFLGTFHISTISSQVQWTRFVLNPTWIFMFTPGWMLRIQILANQKTQQLLAENRRQKEDLEAAHAELMQYIAEAEELAALRERNRMAGEIHDTVGHALTSVIRGADACLELIDPGASRLRRHLLAMRDTAQESLQSIRMSVRSIHSSPPVAGSWESVLTNFAQRVYDTTGTSVVFETPMPIDPAKRYTIFQCIKEAVTNAIRHGKASRVTIEYKQHEDGEVIMIRDNGQTPEFGNVAKGFGLESMERRMKSIGGDVSYHPLEDGFQVILVLSGNACKEDGVHTWTR